MQDNRTRKQQEATVESTTQSRPTATGRIAHPHTARLTWLRAITTVSEERCESLRLALGQPVGVAR